jgi:ABC-type Fe3+/spermidine/putrescine transport system ATPase subunit
MDRSNIQITISLDKIKKTFKEVSVIDDISLELKDGEFLSLLGPSGAGKTTLLRMIAGLELPTDGTIKLRGKDISLTPPNKRNLGMVFQQYALFPHMTVWENIAYGLKARKKDRDFINKRVDKYLNLMGLSNLSERKPKQLSGGQQQRVSLARALAIEPVVILFDEPLSNLDERLKDQMLHEIKNLHEALGFTAVYVTHSQNEALFLSDKIAVLNKGKIEQFGIPEDILSFPKTSFVANFFGYTNHVKGAVLTDKESAALGNLKIPVGYVQKDCARGDRGFLYMRSNAVNICCSKHNLQPSKEQNSKTEVCVLEARYLGGQTELKVEFNWGERTAINIIVPGMMKPLPKLKDKLEITFNKESVVFYKYDSNGSDIYND